MLLLISFAFIAGIVTILSPCILPILPIVLSGSIDGGKRRPLGVVTGFIISFTFFTLFLTTLVRLTGISADALRTFSVVIVFGFGLSLLIPRFQVLIEKFFSKVSGAIKHDSSKATGFRGGLLLGISLGLVWTPCVGPILGSVISLALTGSVNGAAVFITLAYSFGTAIPLLVITYGGRKAIEKFPLLTNNLDKIQKIFGIIMIVTALGVYFNVDRTFQSYILEKFPQYGVGLTKLEDKQAVQDELENLNIPTEGTSLLQKTIQSQAPSAPEIIPGGEWFNSEPLTISELKGKVVLIDFWTYTCINCIRTLPYLKDWHEKYADEGLVIIGVHTPEFEFEKDADNVKEAIANFEIKYPVVQDNNYETWRAYNNRYWPAKYFIDKDGKLRDTHFGEGEYDESERIIQELLVETGVSVDASQIDNPKYTVQTRTPELYLGYDRIEALASPEKIKKDRNSAYTAPAKLRSNQFAYIGNWEVSSEYAAPDKGELQLRFSSKDVFLVMRPRNDQPGKVKVYLDDEFIIDILVDADRLYELMKLPQPGEHILRLKFEDNNLELFAFTFG